MLVTDAKLTDKQRQKVTSSDGLLITTLQPRAVSPYVYSRESTYDLYFDAPTDKPDIVVWTDAGSASASSELLTGALRDYGTAVQMGTTTYGKGCSNVYTSKRLYGYGYNQFGTENDRTLGYLFYDSGIFFSRNYDQYSR